MLEAASSSSPSRGPYGLGILVLTVVPLRTSFQRKTPSPYAGERSHMGSLRPKPLPLKTLNSKGHPEQ